VCCQISPYAYEFDLTSKVSHCKVQPVPLLDPVVDDPLPAQHGYPPPPPAVDGEEDYLVPSVEECWI